MDFQIGQALLLKPAFFFEVSMNLIEKINFDLKEAMKSGDKLRLQTIRSIRASILEFEKSGSGKDMTAEVELDILNKAAKKRKDSIEQFRNAGREELAQKEEEELKIISGYLPKQLSREELIEEIKLLAQQINAKTSSDFAMLMPVAAKTFKGKADGKLVKDIVELVLNDN